MRIENRAFISYDTPCPFDCKHCYTYGILRPCIRPIDEIVDSIAEETFDIIYVSQKNDNFSNPAAGVLLCQKAFNRYHTDLFVITRNAFWGEDLLKLETLRDSINAEGKQLFIAVSMNAMDSYGVSENAARVPSPEERMRFIEELSIRSFSPILMLRPIFPSKMIPVSECLGIIEKTHEYISCVVSSGLGVNDDVLARLGFRDEDFCYLNNQEYLQGAISCDIRFVDVQKELYLIRNKCDELNVPFFEHSMAAINSLNK